MTQQNEWIVENFRFLTQQDANQAQTECENIKKLEAKLDYTNPNMVKMVYDKAIENRLFKTPVGYEFLRKLQKILLENSETSNQVQSIPVMSVFNLRESTTKVVERVKASKKPPKKSKEYVSKKISIWLNVALMCLVAVMFWVAMTSSNPNIINYERAIQNKYASWEQQLQERENIVREKEKELLIQNND